VEQAVSHHLATHPHTPLDTNANNRCSLTSDEDDDDDDDDDELVDELAEVADVRNKTLQEVAQEMRELPENVSAALQSSDNLRLQVRQSLRQGGGFK
jgi:hypothetical protein